MTCHRDGARHCACTPELAALEPRLELHTLDARAHAALKILASPLAVEVLRVAQTTSVVRGDVGALLEAAARSLPAAPLLDRRTGGAGRSAVPGEHVDPTATLPHRAELIGSLQRSLDHQRPGTATALVFCGVGAGDGDLPPSVTAAVAARIRSHLRRSDLLAHCGRGRFVVLLPDVPAHSGEVAAARIVGAVRGSLSEPVATQEGLYPLQAVVGSLVHAPAEAEAGAGDDHAVDLTAVDGGQVDAVAEFEAEFDVEFAAESSQGSPEAPTDGGWAERVSAADLLAAVERAMDRAFAPRT
ncbi:diguanylate cyclase domain-containing protein [Quadrisphaera setariae]|uniref:Diguanylate cyclase n=1 Tax=Quadrisphaera setariae TaxID=2593304 RepID=A0A5C8ZKB7_9ACTN|nr:diguanylate cyclase [Quadrisphaera setariae]TXR57599.1 diguanylate cyclase [Quadrisphaera setariae]